MNKHGIEDVNPPPRRRTRQREEVSAALAAAGGFVSAQTLHAGLRDSGSTIGIATVYRALADLAEDHAADALQHDGETLYRACESTGHHHHLICRSCGRTVEISAARVESWARAVAAEHGFADPDHVVDLFGTCPDCSPG
jgi:Fur family ferric uptake transcriptional regulator